MATSVNFNNVAYSVPAYNDSGYAQGAGNLSSYLIALASGTLQQAGGMFSLTADVNFGANFGLLSKYYTSTTTNPATLGTVRLAKTDTIDWRNNANSANLPLGINGSDALTYNGNVIVTGSGSGTGNLTDVGTDGIVITGGTGAVVGTGTSLAQHVADSTHNGYLSSTDWTTFNNKQTAGNYITALTGDVTATGPGSVAATLATVNGNVGTFNLATITVNGKGLITAASSGTTPITVPNGGTGDSSFTAYSVLCGGTTSTGALQNVSGVGTSGQVLTSNGAATLPTWQSISGSGTVNSGTAGQIAYYASSGTTISGLTPLTFTPNTLTLSANFPILAIASTGANSATITMGIPSFLSTLQATNGTWSVTDSTNSITFLSYAYNAGSPTITFVEPVVITPTTNQLVLGTTRTVTISATQPATSSRTYTMPDAGGNATFPYLELAQTFTAQQTLSAAAGNPIHGTNTNNNASAGYTGEYIESVASATNFPSTGVFGDLTSISLTAGDWDVTALLAITANGATITGNTQLGVSSTSGNSATGLVQGSNLQLTLAATATSDASVCIPNFRVSLNATTTYYLKYKSAYTGGPPQGLGRISARRVR